MKEEKNNDFMDNPNLSIFNKVRKVSDNALKQINAGRLKGMSDVNPVWRILAMTDTFGVCGVGWKYEITKQWTKTYGNEIKGFCNINMFIKVDGEWSDAIPGTGGASFVAMERNGAYVSDEVYKMALTDALSVAMKSIGVAADIYFSKGADLGTKYAINEQAADGSLPTQSTDPNLEVILANIKAARNTDELKQIWDDCYSYQSNPIFKGAMSTRKKELK